eukprot:Selendium_serpulae@DN9642_c0_g1_i1.p1
MFSAVDQLGSCGHEIPCITAYFNKPNGDPDCSKCFRMTIIEAGDVGETVCTDGCPVYKKDVYIRAIAQTGAATFEVAQNAWDVVCPYVYSSCGAGNCVVDSGLCVRAPLEENWSSSHTPIHFVEVVW